MAIKLIPCPACGTRNVPDRVVCLRCGASLAAPLLSGREEDQTDELTRGSLSEWINRYTRNWNTIRAMQFAFISAVLLVALSVFYYLVIFAPKKEEMRRKEEQARIELQRREAEDRTKLEAARVALEVVKEQVKQQEKAEAEAKAAVDEVLLDTCLADAYKAYVLDWAKASQLEAQRRVAQIQRGQVTVAVNCVQLRVNPSICRSVMEALARQGQAASKYSPTSPLPILVADSLSNSLYRQKDECYKRYPQR